MSTLFVISPGRLCGVGRWAVYFAGCIALFIQTLFEVEVTFFMRANEAQVE